MEREKLNEILDLMIDVLTNHDSKYRELGMCEALGQVLVTYGEEISDYELNYVKKALLSKSPSNYYWNQFLGKKVYSPHYVDRPFNQPSWFWWKPNKRNVQRRIDYLLSCKN